jgi:hypothetical protein
MSDYLFDAAMEHGEAILRIYQMYADRKPVMLYDIQEKRIYVYPYAGFAAELSERSQEVLKEQRETASAGSQIVVFVRDNMTRRLVSFTLENE